LLKAGKKKFQVNRISGQCGGGNREKEKKKHIPKGVTPSLKTIGKNSSPYK